MNSKALLVLAVAGMVGVNMNPKPKKEISPKLREADEGVRNNPVLAHMRNVAYTPISDSFFSKERHDLEVERIRKAEEKRLRKQERNLKNANKR